jgi:hypothetical protein
MTPKSVCALSLQFSACVGRRLLGHWISSTAPKPLHFDWTTKGMPNPVVMFVDAVFPPVLPMCTFRQVPYRVYSDSFETSSRRRPYEMMSNDDYYSDESINSHDNSHDDPTPVSQASPPPSPPLHMSVIRAR